VIRKVTRQLRQSRLVRNSGAMAFMQVAQIASQLLAVPIFAHQWGLETYGTWLLLFTIPSYLAVTDLGLTIAATNDMIMNRARGELEKTARTYQTLRRAIMAVGLLVVTLAALILLLVAPHIVAFAQAATGGHAPLATLLLVCYGVMSLQLNSVIGGLRASDRWAQTGLAYAFMFGAETILAVTLVVLGANVLGVAFGYFAVRALALPLFSLWLRRTAPELVLGPSRFDWGELKRLARPALAGLSLPVGIALSLQGTVAVVGAQAGLAAVPVFNAVRTLSRVGYQLTNMVSSAAMPLFGVATATGQRVKQASLLIVSLGTCAAVLIPVLLVLSIFGRDIVLLWTHDAIRPDQSFVTAMAVVMVLNAVWMALSNIMLSINRHESFAWLYLLLSVASVGLTWWLAGILGPLGAALSLIFLDGVMLAYLIFAVARSGLFTRTDFLRAGHELTVRGRGLLGA